MNSERGTGMVYVMRNDDGEVTSVSLHPDTGHSEAVERSDAALLAFVRQVTGGESLEESDLPFVRVIEDLVDLLIARDLIRFTDLPDAAQEKLMRRRSLRATRHALDILVDGGDVL